MKSTYFETLALANTLDKFLNFAVFQEELFQIISFQSI